jgi:seryl-tRNA synthetase
LLWRIGGYDPERGCKVAGQRGYFLRDGGVLLNQALLAFATDFLQKRGYSPIQVPYFMKKDLMAGIAQLADFDDQLYKVSTGHAGTADDPGDKYLIATSEQPLCAFHAKEVLDDRDLPLRYCGVSTCFRKEVGKANVDNRGIFRVHQFEKVEQFCITVGCLEDSRHMHMEMLRCAEEFHQALGLAYRVVNIVSGELNDAAVMKFDLEGWFPGQGTYRELVSCSNCTDFQSRAMDIRHRTHEVREAKDSGKGKASETRLSHVHMLNSTLTATGRAICCILETYQTPTGVHVPEALVPFMNGTTFLPFTRKGRPSPKEAHSKVAVAQTSDNQVNVAGVQPADLVNGIALKELDDRLLDLPYMGGFVPTALDRDTFETMDAAVLANYPNLRRWHIQIASFSAGERIGWP